MPMSPGNSDTRSGTASLREIFRQECLFWGSAAVLLFIFLCTPEFGHDEMLRMETAREMLLTGSLLQPICNWQNVFGSPAVTYWFLFPFIELFGVTEFAFRLPGVLAALGTLWCMRLLGKVFFSRRSALIASWMLLGSWGFLFVGRNAAPDMIGSFFVFAGITLFYCCEGKTEGRFSTWFLFFLAAFAAAFFKGIQFFFLPLFLIVPRIFSDEGRKALRSWKLYTAFAAAAFLAGALFLLPAWWYGLTGMVSTPWIMESALTLSRKILLADLCSLIAGWQGKTALFRVFFFLLPWAPLLAAGFAGMLKNRENLPETIKAPVCGTALICLWSVLPLGKFHEALPVALFFVILFGCGGLCEKGIPQWNRIAFKASGYVCLIAASLGICSIIAYPLWNKLAGCTPPAAAVIAPVAAGVVSWIILFMDYRRNSAFAIVTALPHRIGSVIFSAAVMSGCFMSVLYPVYLRETRKEKSFFTALYEAGTKARRTLTPGDGQIVFFGKKVPAAFLCANEVTKPVLCVENVNSSFLEATPGSRIILFFKKSPENLKKFTGECARLKIAPGEPFLTEEISRWRTPAPAMAPYTAYMVTLPGKEGKSTEESVK